MTPVWWYWAVYRYDPGSRSWSKHTVGPFQGTDSQAMRGAFDAAQDPSGVQVVVVVYRKLGAMPWAVEASYTNQSAIVGDASSILRTVIASLLFALILAIPGCTPAIIGVSAAFGAASVAVTYEVSQPQHPTCDAGKD